VISRKLEQGVRAQRIYEDLAAPERGYPGSDHSVRRLANKLLSIACEPAKGRAALDSRRAASRRFTII